MNDSLHEFISQASAQGQTTDQIRQQLIAVGWDESAVAAALHDIFSQQNLNRTLPTQLPISLDTVSPQEYSRSLPSQQKKYKNYHVILSIAFFLLIGGGVVGGTYYYYRGNPITPRITQTTPEEAQRTTAVATTSPIVASYSNDEYGFRVALPDSWSVKEYPPELYGSERRFAFGTPSDVPSEFFTRGNYVWMRVFPRSDESLYAEFAYLVSLVGKDDSVFTTILGGKNAVQYRELIAAEYNSFVYELHLIEKIEGEKILGFNSDSETILKSFTFTD